MTNGSTFSCQLLTLGITVNCVITPVPPTSIQYTITATASASLLPAERSRYHSLLALYAFWLGVPGIVVFGFSASGAGVRLKRVSRHKAAALLASLIIMLLAMGLVSCGGSFTTSQSLPGLGAGNYLILIQPTNGSVQYSIVVPLTVGS